jgi:hypothetical protein
MKHLGIKHAPAFSLASAAASFPSQPTQAEQPARQNAGFFRRLQTCSLIAATLFAGASPSMAQTLGSAQGTGSIQAVNPSDSDAYTTAVEYVVHFYPLWFSNQQLQVNNRFGTTNRMVAPYSVGPTFKYVVAGNYDTLYSTANLDLTAGPVDGTKPEGYVLTFPAGQLPDAKLFWSVTTYTPDAIELVPNPANKYVVASYTPGLTYNGDGSLTVYMSTQPPAHGPIGNWLPIPPGKFNIVLRVYGPQGNVADNTYVPPGIARQ